MNPVRVFLSIFGGALLLAVILGIIGTQQEPIDEAAEENGDVNGEESVELADAPASLDGCLACHGDTLEGASGPALLGLEQDEAEIVDIIQNGIGAMPAQDLDDQEAQEVAQYLLGLEEGGNGDAEEDNGTDENNNDAGE